MKIRVKFSKTGRTRFIGHLDILRYFQKTIARSGIPAVYTKGYSPHMILSFASPLGVGDTSMGEYFDLETAYCDPFAQPEDIQYLKDIGVEEDSLSEAVSSDEIVKLLNAVSAEGIRVLSARRLPEGRAGNAMASVCAADYILSFRDGFLGDVELDALWPAFLSQESIPVEKETKSGKHTVDIRPMILESSLNPLLGGIYIKCLTGSAANLKPELAVEAFCRWLQKDYDEYGVSICRLDLYDSEGKSLGEAGKILEQPASPEQPSSGE